MYEFMQHGMKSGIEWASTAENFEVQNYVEDLSASLKRGRPWSELDMVVNYVSNYSSDPDWDDFAAMLFWTGFDRGVRSFWKEMTNQA